jgi:signal peptidase II
VAVDQLTKFWIIARFSLYESKVLIPDFFSLTFITNRGAAFGFLNGVHGQWRHIFFIVVAVAALIFLVVAFRQFKEANRLFGVAICLIAGGAIGNLIDRIRLGEVVDFLDFYVKGHHWPAFNVADSAITVGVALFVAGQLFFVDHRREEDKGDK